MKTEPYHIVRNSKIHGKGVFAKRPIRKGTKVIEYTGDIISTDEADIVGAQEEGGHSHTMLFTVDDDRVINGNTGGDAKYINHSCDPNCEAVQYGDKVFIEALRSIPKGQELVYDYHLQVDGKITDKVKKEYACFCGSPDCRGTQIDPAVIKKSEKKQAAKKAKKEKDQSKKQIKEAKKLEKSKAKEEKKKLKDLSSPKKSKDKKKKKKNKKQNNKVKSEE
ncbi:MAG: SET domain-containing protein-lysine N-methyltransferase [Saprospiraceae bacterium]